MSATPGQGGWQKANGEVEIIITPSPDQYRRLCRDLEIMREAGAISNTAAIIDAVRRAAEGYDGDSKKMAGRRHNAPGPATGG